MKKLIISGTGFPTTTKTYQWLQDNALHGIKSVANMHENYTVLWGIEPNASGTIISEGAFVYNGEIIPFLASVPGGMVTINDVIEDGNFNTNPNNITSIQSLPAYSTKTAQIGTAGVVTFNYSQFKRLPKVKIFELSNFEFSFSGVFIKDITSEVDINIVKRAFDWDLTCIEASGAEKMLR